MNQNSNTISVAKPPNDDASGWFQDVGEKTFSIALLDDDENVRNEIELFLLLNQFARHLIQKYSFPCFSFSTRFSRSQRQPVSCRTMRVYK